MGVRPIEMLLMGLGGCSAFDVVLILRKGRQPPSSNLQFFNFILFFGQKKRASEDARFTATAT